MNPEVARQMQATYPEIPIASPHTWEEGRFRRTDDAVILMEAYRQGLTLVTYDTRTIVPLLKMWSEQGITHGGVIVVKASTIAQDNIGGLMRALVKLWTEYGDQEWTNASIYLSP